MFQHLKIIKKIFVFLIVLFFVIFLFSRGKVFKSSELEYGVTFSKKQAESLGLDWQKVFQASIDELGVKNFRLSAYWDESEPAQGEYAWQDLDWQVNTAKDKGVKIILAVGGRLPRWPECHYPDWAEKLSKEEREASISKYIATAIDRYKNNEAITAWQVENEPFLSHFGDCPVLDKAFLDKEIALVRSLDKRPIVITDSGELSVWVPASRRADIFGTTMYLNTYSRMLRGYVRYPIEPGFFRFKKNIANLFSSPQKWVVIELQAEPWGPIPYQEMTFEQRSQTMDVKKFREIVEFARQAGFREFYLWGVEWWYWERAQGRGEMWDEARGVFEGAVN